MREQELKGIPGLREDEVVIIRKYSYGDKCALMGKVAEVGIEGGKEKAVLLTSNLRLLGLAYGIKSAPFFPTENIQWDTIGLNEPHIERRLPFIKALDAETGDYLFQEIVKFNKSLTEEIKKKLPLSLKEEVKP